MKRFRILTAGIIVAIAGAFIAPATLRAQDDQTTPPAPPAPMDQAPPPAPDDQSDQTGQTDQTPSLDYFSDALQPYGQWIQVDGLGDGYAWQPTAAQDPNWQPYTDGYWAYTDAGWTWVSYEDFGWITYHYGRWANVEDIGWVWVPGYEWGPAWVSWRASRDYSGPGESAYIGWAPLPPECEFRPDTGISVWVDADFDIGPRYYNFCRVRDFGAPVLGPVIIDRSRNVTIISQTTNITNITTSNNVVYNGGPSYRVLSKRVDPAHPIQALHLVRQSNAAAFRHGGKGAIAQTKGNQLIVAAPAIAPPKQPFKPAKVSKVVNKPVVSKGWTGVNPAQKAQLQTAIKAQNKGIKPHQSAKPVTAQQLSVVPKANASVSPAPGRKGTPPSHNPQPAVAPGNTAPPSPGKPLPTASPGVKPRPKPFATPGASPAPGTTAHPKPNLTPFNPNVARTPAPQTPPGKLTPVPSKPPVVAPPHPATPPPKLTPPQPNAAAIEEQRKLQQEKAAAAAAAAHRAQAQQTPPPRPSAPVPPRPAAPEPPHPAAAPVPEKGGKPTPTPTPH